MELELDSAPRLWCEYLRAVALGPRRFPRGTRPRVPEASAHLATLTVDPDALRDYRAICHFPDALHLPSTYPYVLATPVAAAMLVRGRFPYPLAGIVHVRQHIDQRRPISVREPMSVRTWLGEEREVARGVEFDTHTEISCADETVWTGVAVALVRDPARVRDPKSRGPEHRSERRGLESTRFTVPGDIGRRYARITQDYNPIHLWPLTARLFGFARPIAHGMWSLARGLAAVQEHLPPAPLALDCEFRRPVPLPCELRLFRYEDETGLGFSLRDASGEKKHLECTVRPA